MITIQVAGGLFLLSILACNFVGERENSRRNLPKTELKVGVEELGKYIGLPFEAKNAVFEVKQIGDADGFGPTDYAINAVIEFDEQDVKKIIIAAEKYELPKETEIETANWFPPATQNIRQGTTYSAKDFYKSPYLNGNLVRIGKTNYFYLSLFTT